MQVTSSRNTSYKNYKFMDSSQFIGSFLSINCGPILGVYQGTVSNVNPETQSICLNQPFRNGIPFDVEKVTLRAADIVNLEVLRLASDMGDEEPEIIPVPKPKNKPRTNSGPRTMYPGNSSSAQLTKGSDYLNFKTREVDKARGLTKPRRSLTPDPLPPSLLADLSLTDDFTTQGFAYNDNPVFFTLFPDEFGPVSKVDTFRQPNFKSQKKLNQQKRDEMEGFQDFSGAYRLRAASFSGKGESKGEKRNDYLFAPIDEDLMAQDFDFEANLAMFDKKAFQNNTTYVPTTSAPNPKNFRHDQNIITDASRVSSWISTKTSMDALSGVPISADNPNGNGSNVTDNGLIKSDINEESCWVSEIEDKFLNGSNEHKDGIVATARGKQGSGSSGFRSPDGEFLANGMVALDISGTSSSILSGSNSISGVCSAPPHPGSLPKLTSKKRRKLLAAGLEATASPEFLAANMAQRVLECLRWPLAMSEGVKSNRGATVSSDNSSPVFVRFIDQCFLSSGRKIVILCGPSELSRTCAAFLCVHLSNRRLLNCAGFKTVKKSNSNAAGSQLTVYLPNASRQPGKVRFQPDVKVVHSTGQLPKSRDTGLVISLWGEFSDPDCDLPSLSPLLAEWIRGGTQAGAGLVEVEPRLAESFACRNGGGRNAEKRLSIFATVFPADSQAERLLEGGACFCVDIGVPLRLLEGCQETLKEGKVTSLAGAEESTLTLSDLAAVMYADGFCVRVN